MAEALVTGEASRVIDWCASNFARSERESLLGTYGWKHMLERELGEHVDAVAFGIAMLGAGFQPGRVAGSSLYVKARWLELPAGTPFEIGRAMRRAVEAMPTSRIEILACAGAVEAGYLGTRTGRHLWRRYSDFAGLPFVAVDGRNVVATAHRDAPFGDDVLDRARWTIFRCARLDASPTRIIAAAVPRGEREAVARRLVRLTCPEHARMPFGAGARP